MIPAAEVVMYALICLAVGLVLGLITGEILWREIKKRYLK